MPAINNINPHMSAYSEAESHEADALLREFASRLGSVIRDFRAAHGFDTGTANPFLGQTIITNGLMREAALNVAATCFLSTETLQDAHRGFMTVFSTTLESKVPTMLGVMAGLAESDFPDEGHPFVGAMLTALLNQTRPI
jgi:hypothetical protein